MKIELRRKAYKIPVIYLMCQKIVDYNNRIFYKLFNRKYHHAEKIKQLKDFKKGQRCFIVGNGPSLMMEDLALISNEDSFASNLIYKVFDKTSWRPKYYFIQDRYADTGNVLDTLDLEYMFIGDYYWRKRGINNKNAICVHSARSFSKETINFSTDISKKLVSHCTITYSMIQAAIYMGYTEIYLIGMDHNYALSVDEKGNVIENLSVKSHIFEDRYPKDVIANIEGMNKAYISARNYAEKNGIHIYNVTRGGRLEWFERKSLEESLKEIL